MKIVTPLEGHLILYCKNNYDVPDVDFITGIQRIWAVRCGYDNDNIDDSSLEYIADELYNIIVKTLPDFDCVRFQKDLHKSLYNKYYVYNEIPFSHTIILSYRNQLMQLQIRTDHETLIQLPEMNKELFKRIVAGNGKYEDSKFINK